MVTNGVEGQLGIAGEAPGDPDYNGGSWAVNTVTFNEGDSHTVAGITGAACDEDGQ